MLRISGLLAALLVVGSTAAQTPPAQAPPAPDLTQVHEAVRAGDFDKAATELAELRQTHPDDVDVLMLSGEVLLTLKRPEQALPLLERVAELEPDRPRVHFQLASALLQTGDRQEALETFAREIELTEDPEIRAMAHLNRSLVFQQQGRTDAAAAELEAVLAADPERSGVYGDLAVLYLEASQVDRASQTLEAGLEHGFRSATHFYNLGAKHFEAQSFDRAAAAFARAIEIDPQMAIAEKAWGTALERSGKKAEAATHLLRYLELAPDDPEAAAIRRHAEALAR